LSNGSSTGVAMPGPAAAQTALTPIRTAQTPPEKFCDSSLKSSPQGPEVTDATITGNNYK
jgi:hypothetical protein